MKKIKVAAVLMALVMAVTFVCGCGEKKNNAEEYKTVLKYNGKEYSSKYYFLIADVIKSSYLSSAGYADGEVDKSQYMTLKHILVNFEKEDGTTRTEEEALAEANSIKAQITDDNFDQLMAELSEDPGSKAQPEGYTFAHNDKTMVQEFDDGGWALEVGQVSEPIKTSYGYHIIKRVELNEAGLPKSSNDIDWEKEMDGEEKVIDIIRKSAYSWLEEAAVLSAGAESKGIAFPEEEYDDILVKAYSSFGGEEDAKKFFERRKMTDDEIKEIVKLMYLADEFYLAFMEDVDCGATFAEYIASPEYLEMKEYYSQMGQDINYTEYNPDDETLNQDIKQYAYTKYVDAELAKIEKVEDVYNSYI